MFMVVVLVVTIAFVIVMLMSAAAFMIMVLMVMMLVAIVVMVVMAAGALVIVMFVVIVVLVAVVVTVMMVVMVAATGMGLSGVAIHLRTGLPFFLQLHGHMVDAMLLQFLTDCLLQGSSVAILSHNVEGGIVIVAIQAPNMEMVDTLDMMDMGNMMLQFLGVNALRGLFHKYIQHFAEALGRMAENEHGNADGHNGVNEGKVRKADHHSADQDHHPAQHILQHMQVHSLLIE
jgi:hypothetical protein